MHSCLLVFIIWNTTLTYLRIHLLFQVCFSFSFFLFSIRQTWSQGFVYLSVNAPSKVLQIDACSQSPRVCRSSPFANRKAGCKQGEIWSACLVVHAVGFGKVHAICKCHFSLEREILWSGCDSVLTRTKVRWERGASVLPRWTCIYNSCSCSVILNPPLTEEVILTSLNETFTLMWHHSFTVSFAWLVLSLCFWCFPLIYAVAGS